MRRIRIIQSFPKKATARNWFLCVYITMGELHGAVLVAVWRCRQRIFKQVHILMHLSGVLQKILRLRASRMKVQCLFFARDITSRLSLKLCKLPCLWCAFERLPFISLCHGKGTVNATRLTFYCSQKSIRHEEIECCTSHFPEISR